MVRLVPMNNAIQVFKKNEPETLENMQGEWAQELSLARHQVLLKTDPQLKKLSERKLYMTFDEVNSAALCGQRKTEKDFARVHTEVGCPDAKNIQPSMDQAHVPWLG